MHSLGLRSVELNSTFVSLLGFVDVTETERLPLGELRQLIDSQAEIVDLIASNAPLEDILAAVTERVEQGWTSERAFAAIAMSAEDEGRSVFASPALTAAVSVDAELEPSQLFPTFPIAVKAETESVVEGSELAWPVLEILKSKLLVSKAWLVPMLGSAAHGTSWLALYTPDRDPLSETERFLLHRYARLASIAIEQHHGELRLHRLIAEERQRLAGVLHDDPIQAMTAVSLRVQRLARHVNEDATELAVDLQKSVTTAIDRMRRLLIDLHPPTLDNEGLVSAIDVYLAEVLEPLDIECELVDDVQDEPSIETASLAYRLAVEALWNVAKHANASRVAVLIHARAGAVEIRIDDNGVGFDDELHRHSRAGHLGLSACRALSARASGSWTVESEPGQGTTVTIRLPGQLPTTPG